MGGLLDAAIKALVKSYLEDQAEDLRAWLERGLRGIDPGELSMAELAGIVIEALRNTMLHGKPPPD